MNTILVANTHPVTQAALALLLHTRLHDAELWTAAHWDELLTLVEKHRPGVILLDGNLPGCTTAQGLALLRKNHPGAKVLLLGTQMDAATNNVTVLSPAWNRQNVCWKWCGNRLEFPCLIDQGSTDHLGKHKPACWPGSVNPMERKLW